MAPQPSAMGRIGGLAMTLLLDADGYWIGTAVIFLVPLALLAALWEYANDPDGGFR